MMKTAIALCTFLLTFNYTLQAQESRTVLPPITDDDSLAAAAKIPVKRIELNGNTVFSKEELAELTAAYEGRTISAEELQELKRSITGYYVHNGYINSGAVIPEQTVNDGVIRIDIIEGRLSDIRVHGLKRLRPAYISERLQKSPDAVLNIQQLQEQLKLLEQTSLIERINAKLEPAPRRGESILDVEATESKPYRLDFSINNHRSPSVGAWRGEVEGSHFNLSGRGDSLRLRYGLAGGLDDYALKYTLPVSARDAVLSFEAERSDALIVEQPFEVLEMESNTDNYAVGFYYPRYRNTQGEFGLGVKFAKRRSRTYLLGEAFNFSAGSENGESKVSVLSFSQQWLSRGLEHVAVLRSRLNFGLDVLDATVHEDLPDGRFISWLGQFQYLRRTALWKSQVLLRLDTQLSNDSLLSLEKFAVGGKATVRGYRENSLTRDNGIIVGVEWRIPITKVQLPWFSTRAEDGTLELAPFVDYGRAWNTDTDTPEPDDISSAGLGLLWSPGRDFSLQLYWGKAFTDLPVNGEHDLQDEGFHLELRGRLF